MMEKRGTDPACVESGVAGAMISAADHDLVADDLVLRVGERLVMIADAAVDLTNAEFNMLRLLLAKSGNVVTKAELTEAGLSRPLEKYDRSVDMHISNLRKKIGTAPDGGRRIETVRGIGYLYSGGVVVWGCD